MDNQFTPVIEAVTLMANDVKVLVAEATPIIFTVVLALAAMKFGPRLLNRFLGMFR